MSFTDFGKCGGVTAAFLLEEWDRCHTRIRGDLPHLRITNQFLNIKNINIRLLNIVYSIAPSSKIDGIIISKQNR